MKIEEHYFWQFAEPYLRAKLDRPGHAATEEDRAMLLQAAQAANLKVHFLKRLANPRMLRAIGMVQAAWPESLLDIGSGKGFLLWHLSEMMPDLQLLALDRSGSRLTRIAEVAKAAGLKRLHTIRADAAALPLTDGSVDAVALFEVLEHVADPLAVMRDVARVARRHVFISVPAKPDDNPEHLRLFDKGSLISLLRESGVWTAKHEPPIERDDLHFYVFVRRTG